MFKKGTVLSLIVCLYSICVFAGYDDFEDPAKKYTNETFVKLVRETIPVVETQRYLVLDGIEQRTAKAIHEAFPGIRPEDILTPQLDAQEYRQMKDTGIATVTHETSGSLIARLKKNPSQLPNAIYLDYMCSPSGNESYKLYPMQEILDLLQNSPHPKVVLGVTFCKRCPIVPQGFEKGSKMLIHGQFEESKISTAAMFQIYSNIRKARYQKSDLLQIDYSRAKAKSTQMVTFFFTLEKYPDGEELETFDFQLTKPAQFGADGSIYRPLWGFDPKGSITIAEAQEKKTTGKRVSELISEDSNGSDDLRIRRSPSLNKKPEYVRLRPESLSPVAGAGGWNLEPIAASASAGASAAARAPTPLNPYLCSIDKDEEWFKQQDPERFEVVHAVIYGIIEHADLFQSLLRNSAISSLYGPLFDDRSPQTLRDNLKFRLNLVENLMKKDRSGRYAHASNTELNDIYALLLSKAEEASRKRAKQSDEEHPHPKPGSGELSERQSDAAHLVQSISQAENSVEEPKDVEIGEPARIEEDREEDRAPTETGPVPTGAAAVRVEAPRPLFQPLSAEDHLRLEEDFYKRVDPARFDIVHTVIYGIIDRADEFQALLRNEIVEGLYMPQFDNRKPKELRANLRYRKNLIENLMKKDEATRQYLHGSNEDLSRIYTLLVDEAEKAAQRRRGKKNRP